ncbi:MAG: FMN-binding protein [Clostridiales Family XIII bacterium]|nr:FMN-binding protein [Clostridiales Family XIII bacterium]
MIIAVAVAPVMQAALPSFDLAMAAEPDCAEVSEEGDATGDAAAPPKVDIKKDPKPVRNAKKAPHLPPSPDQLEKCADGTYTGTGKGYAGYITVKVVIKSHAIKSIEITDIGADDPPYVAKAKKVIGYILKAQSTDVDAVSGATFSSNGIIAAVRDALGKAAGKKPNNTPKKPKKDEKQPEDKADTELDGQKFRDGTYTGIGAGFNGEIHVSVDISGGLIVSVSVTKHEEDEPYMASAMALIGSIISTQSINVDTVTGATYSSRGIIAAVKDALKKAVVADDPELSAPMPYLPEPKPPEPVAPAAPQEGSGPDDGYEAVYGMYVDGIYRGLARGYKSTFQATVSIVDGSIAEIGIVQADDDEYYRACAGIVDRIIRRQTTDGIDAVSGATFSSRGILDSVRSALSRAKKPDEPAQTEEPATPDEPVQAEEPAAPGEPAQAEEPAAPGEPAQAEEPAAPGEPAQAEEPATPGEPAQTGVPVVPEIPCGKEEEGEPDAE